MFAKYMNRVLIALGFLCIMVAAVQACPEVAEAEKSMIYNSDDLYEAKYFEVVAGGDTDISVCPEFDGRGFIASRPDFSMTYTPIRSSKSGSTFELEFRTDGSCDTVLLINDGDENWLFDDDTGDGDNGLIRLTSPPSGRYDIWVGTFGSANCDTRLAMETF